MFPTKSVNFVIQLLATLDKDSAWNQMEEVCVKRDIKTPAPVLNRR